MKTKFMTSLAKLVAVSALCLSTINLWGQNSEYKVFYFSGNPIYKDKAKSEKLVRDQVLPQGSTLSIPQGSYVVLVNKSEVPMGMNKPGDYSVTDIKTLYTNMKESNLTQEFFDYLAQSMVSSNDEQRRSGGVYRAVGDLMINPFDSAVVMTNEIPFEWSNPSGKQYYLKIFDIDTWEMICDIPTSDSTLNLNIVDKKLTEGKKYAWVVSQTQGMPQSGTELLIFTIADKDFRSCMHKKLKEAEKKSENQDMRKMMKLRVLIDSDIYPIPPYSEL